MYRILLRVAELTALRSVGYGILMNVLTAPQPQSFKTQYLRNRSRVTPDTPDYDFLCWSSNRRPSDVDRLIYRDSRGVLCAIKRAAVIEFSGRGTLVLLAEVRGEDCPAYRREFATALSGQSALVLREGDQESAQQYLSAAETLPNGHALFVEEKKSTERVSEGERRMLAGLNSAQRQEVWHIHCLPDGTPFGVVSADRNTVLSTDEFRAYVETFGGF